MPRRVSRPSPRSRGRKLRQEEAVVVEKLAERWAGEVRAILEAAKKPHRSPVLRLIPGGSRQN